MPAIEIIIQTFFHYIPLWTQTLIYYLLFHCPLLWLCAIRITSKMTSSLWPAGFPGGSVVKNACRCRRPGSAPWIRKTPWRRAWQPTSGFSPSDSHGQRSLVGYRPWGHKHLDKTEQPSMQALWPKWSRKALWRRLDLS